MALIVLTSQTDLTLAGSLVVVNAGGGQELGDLGVLGGLDSVTAVQLGVGGTLRGAGLLLLWLRSHNLRSRDRGRGRDRSRSRAFLRPDDDSLDRDCGDGSREEGSRDADEVETHFDWKIMY
jgi:hypothetical protein